MSHIKKLIVITAGHLFCFNSFALDFSSASKLVEKHYLLKQLDGESQSIAGKGGIRSSIGDPILKVMAKNIPEESLKRDQTAMSGIDFTLSQKFSLSGKYGAIKDSFDHKRDSIMAKRSKGREELMKSLWTLVISKQELLTRRTISISSQSWVLKQIKVSERLYSNGKIPQQALLELKIRKADLDSKVLRLSYAIKQVEARESYLLGEGIAVEIDTVPWSRILITNQAKDFTEAALVSEFKSKELQLSASKRNLVPDLTLSMTYTLRENIDGLGDFIGAGVSFPLPFSGAKYSGIKESVGDKYQSRFKLENYREKKRATLHELKLKRERIERELQILRKQSIPFSKSSRDISARSYIRGGVSYADLLSSEMKLERLLETETRLVAEMRLVIINYKFLAGEKLHES